MLISFSWDLLSKENEILSFQVCTGFWAFGIVWWGIFSSKGKSFHLPREVVSAPSLLVLKVCFGNALKNKL